MKKVITGFLVIIILLRCNISMAATIDIQALLNNATASSYNGFGYSVNEDGKTVSITGYAGTSKKVVIPDEILGKKVTNIASMAFLLNSDITSASIPKNVTNIGMAAFAGCSSMTEVKLVNGLKTIEDGAFGNCDGLKTITIPDTVTKIGDGVFGMCSNLTQINISKNVTSIGKGTFADCAKLKSINVSKDNKNYTSVGGVLYNKDKTEIIQYPAGKLQSSYKVEETTKKIRDYAFYDNTNLNSVEIPSKVNSFGEDVFTNCDNITILCEKASTAKKYAEKNNLSYLVTNKENIKTVEKGKTVETLLKSIKGKVFNKTKEMENKEAIPTGSKLITDDKTEYSLVSMGDINGDGKITTTDLLKLKQSIVKLDILSTLQDEASDINEDEKVTLTDVH